VPYVINLQVVLATLTVCLWDSIGEEVQSALVSVPFLSFYIADLNFLESLGASFFMNWQIIITIFLLYGAFY
jgi:hypothetical protein